VRQDVGDLSVVGRRRTDGAINGGTDTDDAEVARLQADIAAARKRLESARRRPHVYTDDVYTDDPGAELKAELAASREALANMERQYQEAVASVIDAARAEVERILAAARQPEAATSAGAASSEWSRHRNDE